MLKKFVNCYFLCIMGFDFFCYIVTCQIKCGRKAQTVITDSSNGGLFYRATKCKLCRNIDN